MTQTLQWGPFALPWTLVALGLAVGAGFFVGGRAGRAAGLDAGPPLWRLLLVGAVAARLAFVWEWHGPYLRDPLSVLDLRDGGWTAEAGLAAACLGALAFMRRRPALRRPLLAALSTTFAVWLAGTVALAFAPGGAAPLPPLELRAADGRAVRLADFAGRPVVVNLWASWCPPCRPRCRCCATRRRRIPTSPSSSSTRARRRSACRPGSAARGWRWPTSGSTRSSKPAPRSGCACCPAPSSSTPAAGSPRRASARCRRRRWRGSSKRSARVGGARRGARCRAGTLMRTSPQGTASAPPRPGPAAPAAAPRPSPRRSRPPARRRPLRLTFARRFPARPPPGAFAP